VIPIRPSDEVPGISLPLPRPTTPVFLSSGALGRWFFSAALTIY
jgi:hypothetical protein